MRLTTAQALVRWLGAQRAELLDGAEVPLFPGVFAIFGHGNVLGIGSALYEVRDTLPTWRAQNEQGARDRPIRSTGMDGMTSAHDWNAGPLDNAYGMWYAMGEAMR